MADARLIEQGMERRRVILVYIRDYVDKHQMAPTLQEIADHIGLSINATRGHVQRLKRDGLVTSLPGTPRSIVVARQ